MDLERLRIDRAPRPRRRRKSLLPVVLAGLALLFLFLFRAPLLRAYRHATLQKVRATEAVRTTHDAANAAAGVSANGYIVAARRAALSADTPGRVVEMNVSEGSVVHKGDVVARLFAEEYAAALRRAEAEVELAGAEEKRLKEEIAAARTRLATTHTTVEAAAARVAEATARNDRAKIDYERVLKLKESGAATQQEADTAQTEFDRARATLNMEQAMLQVAQRHTQEGEADIRVAEAKLVEAAAATKGREAARDEAKAILGKTEVKAPFDGIVVLKDAEVGEVVSPNAQGGNSRGAVVTMVDFASLEAQVELPERSLAQVAKGTRAKIFLDAYPDHGYDGTVDRIWPTANRQKGTVEMRVRFDATDERLRPEMGVRVVFLEPGAAEAPPKEPVVLVPQSAVARDGARTGVFELERDVARWRELELGERRGTRVVVKTGLKGGERLVDSPPADLKDGATVHVEE